VSFVICSRGARSNGGHTHGGKEKREKSGIAVKPRSIKLRAGTTLTDVALADENHAMLVCAEEVCIEMSKCSR